MTPCGSQSLKRVIGSLLLAHSNVDGHRIAQPDKTPRPEPNGNASLRSQGRPIGCHCEQRGTKQSRSGYARARNRSLARLAGGGGFGGGAPATAEKGALLLMPGGALGGIDNAVM